MFPLSLGFLAIVLLPSGSSAARQSGARMKFSLSLHLYVYPPDQPDAEPAKTESTYSVLYKGGELTVHDQAGKAMVTHGDGWVKFPLKLDENNPRELEIRCSLESDGLTWYLSLGYDNYAFGHGYVYPELGDKKAHLGGVGLEIGDGNYWLDFDLVPVTE